MIHISENLEFSEISEKEDEETAKRLDAYKKFFSRLKYELPEFKKILNQIKSYTFQDIQNIINYPERYQFQLIDLSNYMYRRSGFYSGVVDYYVNMAMYCWTVDTEVLTEKFYKTKSEILARNFKLFSGEVSKLNLESELHNVLKRVFLEDACFAYFIDTDMGSFLYYLPSNWCSVRKIFNGVPIYGINTDLVSQNDVLKLPTEIQDLLSQKTTSSQDPYVYPPPDKSFCIKYNSHFTYLYPPLFHLLKNVLDIDDYKDLSKARTESENYNLLGAEIPIDDTKLDTLMLTEEIVRPVINTARNILPDAFGVIPSPLKLNPIQWRSNATAERNRVNDAVGMFFDEAGVPKDIFSSASSGAAIKLAIENDATVVYKLYRQIEQIVNLKMMLSKYRYSSHRFVFKLLDVNYFNCIDRANLELRKAQSSLPNKLTLAAVNGTNPSRLLGNEYIENVVLNLGSSWTVLKSSHTQGTDVDESGRPTNDELGVGLSESGEQTLDSDSNNPDSRT